MTSLSRAALTLALATLAAGGAAAAAAGSHGSHERRADWYQPVCRPNPDFGKDGATSRDYAIRCSFRGSRHPAIVWVTPLSDGSALLASPDPEAAG
jgi:hypothetical protein